MNRPPALIFGVPIADVTLDETVGLIAELVEHGRATGRSHQIATVNVDFLVNALDDPELIDILQRASMCIADGMPVLWGCRLLGMPVRERVAGADLVPALIAASQTNGLRIHVFGSAPEVANEATSVLAARYPDARFSIDPGPMMDDAREVPDSVLDSITAVDADVLCVALGNPKQERFIRAHGRRLGTPVLIGVGGSLDMLVGRRRRAPGWVQDVGLEWVVRAAQEPRRLGRRYAHDIRVFGPRLAGAWRAGRCRRDGLGVRIATSVDGGVVANVTGVEAADPGSWSAATERILAGGRLEVDASPGATISDRAAAQLVGLAQLAERSSSEVSWRRQPDELLECLRRIGVQPAMVGLAHAWA